VPDVHTYPGLAALRVFTRGAASVRVAVIDGPVTVDHPCFSGATLETVPAAWTSADDHDDGFVAHGTGIASILFGQERSVIEGIAPDVTGLLIAAATQEDDITELSLVRALDAALDAGADIIHCAFCLSRGVPKARISAHLARTLDTIRERGVLLIAPAGNDAGTATCAPADQSHVIAVGALNNDLSVRDTSNFGVAFHGHGLMAIGEDVAVADPPSAVTTHSGTSVAAPWVTGVAALLLSLARELSVPLSAYECGMLLLDTAHTCTDERAIGGMLAPDRAVHALLTKRDRNAATVDVSVSPSAKPTPATRARHAGLVFALGQLACEPVDDAAFDRLKLAFGSSGVNGTPDSPFSLLTHLRAVNADSDLTHFVLNIGGEPRYVLRAAGPHAAQVIERVINLASASVGIPAVPPLIERVAIPGLLQPQTVTLRDGTVVPVVIVTLPDALTGWRTTDVADAALASFGQSEPGARHLLLQLLDRVCEQQANDGITAADRAFNYAAANATQLAHVAREMSAAKADLVQLGVQPSRYDRPRSDCWDLVATFGDPNEPARSLWQWVWTVDVGDVRPVPLNWPRAWRIEPIDMTERV